MLQTSQEGSSRGYAFGHAAGSSRRRYRRSAPSR
jgi:hypothetical protein